MTVLEQHPTRAEKSFESALEAHRLAPLRRRAATTLQVNIGRLCDLACHHCHVEAGPKRTENMGFRTAERVVELLGASPGITLVDLTGGAPEMNPNFRFLVREACALGRQVIDRCNLTIFQVPGYSELPEFLARNGVTVIASLPCYTKENVEAQRGRHVFEPSIVGLQRLNSLGYGAGALPLDLVYNPVTPELPPGQAELEARYREELRDRFGTIPEEVENLLTLASLRALAATVGVESVVQANDAIVMALRVPVGGAKLPLQKALGPSVQVGNTQMNMPLRRLGDEWLSRLTRVLERFYVFQENLKILAGSASAD